MNLVPVRRGDAGTLHLGEPTGRGYRSICGRTLEGANLKIPMPRFPRSKRHVETHWSRCWQLERVCRSCDRAAP